MMKEIKVGTCIYNEESFNFEFKTNLSAHEKLIFVNSVVDKIVDKDNYNSIIRDIVFDFAIVEVFTNIDVSFEEQKDEDGNDIHPIVFMEQFLEESNVVDIIRENVEIDLLKELNKAVDLNIEYRTGIHPNYLNEALVDLVSTLEQKVKNFDLDSVMNVASKFGDMKEELTMENLVKAYTSTDMFKNNLAEIEDVKNKNK